MVRYAVRRSKSRQTSNQGKAAEEVQDKSLVSHRESDDLLSKLPKVSGPNKMKKVDRQKKKRLAFLKKLEGIQSRELREIASKQRSKTVITGDMMPLVDALPHAEEKRPKAEPAPSKATPPDRRNNGKYTKRKEDSEVFGRVFNHPSFQNDPLKAVTEHLQNATKRNLV